MDLNQLKAEILEDGVIDAAEVKRISTILFEDGVIDRDEAKFLFALNDAKTSAHESWGPFFIDAISSHVLDDDFSNGSIDAEEAAFLELSIRGDGQVDPLEKALLQHLASKVELPDSLKALLA
ncbi:MAG: TerB family tellurite resistance protein [Myxococcota bacterium]|nr:TerB family tellurite resistance protein [Myxococcota bacterium]